jgi:hypothetical protein
MGCERLTPEGPEPATSRLGNMGCERLRPEVRSQPVEARISGGFVQCDLLGAASGSETQPAQPPHIIRHPTREGGLAGFFCRLRRAG